MPHQHRNHRHQKRSAHAVLNMLSRQAGYQPRAKPSARRGGGDQQRQRDRVNLNGGDINERLQHHRQRVAHVQRPRDQFVGHHTPELEDGGGWRKRSDAQRVEEVGDETRQQGLG